MLKQKILQDIWSKATDSSVPELYEASLQLGLESIKLDQGCPEVARDMEQRLSKD